MALFLLHSIPCCLEQLLSPARCTSFLAHEWGSRDSSACVISCGLTQLLSPARRTQIVFLVRFFISFSGVFELRSSFHRHPVRLSSRNARSFSCYGLVLSFFHFSNVPSSPLFSSHVDLDFLCLAVITRTGKYGFIHSGAGEGHTATERQRELLRGGIKALPATPTFIFECGRNLSRRFSMLIPSTSMFA